MKPCLEVESVMPDSADLRRAISLVFRFLLEQAEDNDNPPLPILAGIICEGGLLDRYPSYAEAKTWYNRAVKHDPRAARRIADLYRLGRVEKPTDEDPAVWENLASEWVKLNELRRGVLYGGESGVARENVSQEQFILYDTVVPLADDIKRTIKELVHRVNEKHDLGLDESVLALRVEEAFVSAIEDISVRVPEQAPEKYTSRRDRKENIVHFIKRVYWRELEAGILTRPALLALDGSAYKALENWNGSRDVSEKFHLPTKREMVDRELVSVNMD